MGTLLLLCKTVWEVYFSVMRSLQQCANVSGSFSYESAHISMSSRTVDEEASGKYSLRDYWGSEVVVLPVQMCRKQIVPGGCRRVFFLSCPPSGGKETNRE